MTDTQTSGRAKIAPMQETLCTVGLILLSATSPIISDYPSQYAKRHEPIYQFMQSESSGNLMIETSVEKSAEIITNFVKNLVESQQGFDEDIVQHINDNFFDLI
jgi:hypothetical protein